MPKPIPCPVIGVLSEMFPDHPYVEYLDGSTEPWTVNVICALVRALAPKLVLETGTFQARTTRRLQAAMGDDATLISLESYTEYWEKAVADCSDLDNVKILNVEAVQYLLNYEGPAFNFVFLDDDHGAEHVGMELDLLLRKEEPLMASHSIICVHDVNGIFGLKPVIEARGGFALNLPILHRSGGLGIIQCSP